MDTNRKSSSKAVYTVIDKGAGKSIWVRIGWAHLNGDGSYNLNLDALPVNGKLQMRDWQPRDEYEARPRREEAVSAPPM